MPKKRTPEVVPPLEEEVPALGTPSNGKPVPQDSGPRLTSAPGSCLLAEAYAGQVKLRQELHAYAQEAGKNVSPALGNLFTSFELEANQVEVRLAELCRRQSNREAKKGAKAHV